ncbi:malate dehydrogenase, partial [Candidatus Peregrinibacteria bacterium]|nr:malate dehydrogenase [Candidatus Peregrinibacteria bacterium]
PAVLGKNGVERILEIPLDADELSAFQRTTAHVQSLVKGL